MSDTVIRRWFYLSKQYMRAADYWESVGNANFATIMRSESARMRRKAEGGA